MLLLGFCHLTAEFVGLKLSHAKTPTQPAGIFFSVFRRAQIGDIIPPPKTDFELLGNLSALLHLDAINRNHNFCEPVCLPDWQVGMPSNNLDSSPHEIVIHFYIPLRRGEMLVTGQLHDDLRRDAGVGQLRDEPPPAGMARGSVKAGGVI